MCRMGKPLKPTLWRTARALANSDRLNLMYLVSTAKGTKGVAELAAEANLPVPTASIYLRALNARGLISVVRSGPYVYYGTGSDRSLPVAMSIQDSFRRLFARKSMPTGWTANLLPLLRAYSNSRRETIVRLLRNFQPMRYSELRKLSGLSETSFLRHLDILAAAGIVAQDDKDSYVLANPRNSLAAAFLHASGT